MELISQHTKKIMEGCKIKAREAGLKFSDETLEYIVTNRDILELRPKIMVPTIYDFWVDDVEVLRGKGVYRVYPNNPYETVINTRPPISFYNDNNPDWLNVMIFYHVLAHIDCFQNSYLYRNTWKDDFLAQALAEKRQIAGLRSKHGRWLDYIIEFSRGINNVTGFFKELNKDVVKMDGPSRKIDFYFNIFLQDFPELTLSERLKEVERYNKAMKNAKENKMPEDLAETLFFADVKLKYPEFDSKFNKFKKKKKEKPLDLMQYIIFNSQFLNKKDNEWMKIPMNIVRNTDLYFEPQRRTRILHEGWASYWHKELFLKDERIKGHEIDFAINNAEITALSRAGLNPYAIGLRLFWYIEELANKGKLTYEFERVKNIEQRKKFDQKTGKGRKFLFKVREELSDFTLINNFVDQDFVDKYSLFVAGKRLNRAKRVWEHYIGSRKAEDYKKMLISKLYHPPNITIDEEKTKEGELYLVHHFEGKQLIPEFIHNTMIGIEYLWGNPVKLETTELILEDDKEEPKQQRVLYHIKEKTLEKKEV